MAERVLRHRKRPAVDASKEGLACKADRLAKLFQNGWQQRSVVRYPSQEAAQQDPVLRSAEREFRSHERTGHQALPLMSWDQGSGPFERLVNTGSVGYHVDHG